MSTRTIAVIGWLTLCLLQAAAAQQPGNNAAQRKDQVAAIKASLQKNMAALKHYQWVETTTVSLKGEQKSQTEAKCYYGADGKVQKIPVSTPSESEGKKERGLRGRVVENKKEEMSASTKEAVALVKEYVPPDPARLQAAQAAGNVSVTEPDAEGNVKVTVKDYLKPGDSLAITANAATHRIVSVAVDTYTDTAKNAVNLNVAFGALPDGTLYPEKTELNMAAENLTVAIENSGYEKIGV
jgi:hypothetical protein